MRILNAMLLTSYVVVSATATLGQTEDRSFAEVFSIACLDGDFGRKSVTEILLDTNPTNNFLIEDQSGRANLSEYQFLYENYAASEDRRIQEQGNWRIRSKVAIDYGLVACSFDYNTKLTDLLIDLRSLRGVEEVNSYFPEDSSGFLVLRTTSDPRQTAVISLFLNPIPSGPSIIGTVMYPR